MSRDILIVEDEAAIADVIAYALKTEGFAPHHCSLGEAALEQLRTSTFNLVILDVGLQDISGFEVCRRLRTFSEIPVIFLTARSEEIDRVLGLEIGGDDYVAKPFSPRELVARVRVILRRLSPRPVEPPAPVFEHDAQAWRIRYCGTMLDLTRYEYLLLRTLLFQPERIFSRSQLMEDVWCGAEESSDRTVDTHVKTIRAKLRAIDPEADPIQTHRGVGYSLSARIQCD
jgi:two-component system, OmpR family, catabolic regulation response regulator CreB